MSLDSLYKQGIKRIMNEDYDSQVNYLTVICEKSRHIQVEDVMQANAIFIPNDNYMIHFMGTDIAKDEYGCYYDNGCIWLGNILFPINNLVGETKGFVGFDPMKYLKAKETLDWSLNYYSYSTKKVFDKGKYLYCLDGTFERAMKEGYIIIVDGLFDCLSLSKRGFIAAALLGSVITEVIYAQLRFISKVIVITDNDPAGIKVYNDLNNRLDNVVWLKQGKTKDVDELLKTDFENKFLQLLKQVINNSYYKIHVFK